jgi:hypothetical protein
VAQTKERLGCEAYLGSILDAPFLSRIPCRFDFAILAAVLHHLVGRNRRESREHARTAIINTMRLLRPGGFLIIVEPVFAPALMMDILFYTKRLVTQFTSDRVGIGNTWNNIGAPVVSYFTHDQLLQLVGGIPHGRIVDVHRVEGLISKVMRLTFIKQRFETTLVVEKMGNA